ncbi:MAG: HAMP domain-containing histidine kinase [Chloroflexi bacterium]|nr:MAG: HAMP domain-containing histidine kinase [Chloroflexota bacterium]
MSGTALRIALASMAVAAAAVAIVSVGVLMFGADTFQRLMVEHGLSAEASRAMFDESVTVFFLLATAGAAAGSALLAILLARWLTAPLDRIADVATRIAGGERQVRAPDQGPREVALLARSFNQMAERLEEQERMRAEFIANAAHELRTPLTNLVGYLEALRDGVVAPTQETFASLREEADRLVRLARSLDLLALGDRELGTPLVELDLREAVEMAVELVLPQFERRGIAVSLEVPTGIVGRANPDHLAQVLANLLQNALRYTPSGGRVTITAESGDSVATVSVANTGEEIPAADLPHVFERFYRVDKSRDRARGGAGIGLAIVKQLVELGGGSVGAESRAGLTRVWFRIPA